MQNFIEKWRSGKFASSTLALVLALCVLLSTFGGLAIFANSTKEEGLDIWEDQVTEKPKDADGTEEDPILIENPEQFAYVLSNGGGGLYYKLTTDIYLNDPDKIAWEYGVAMDSANYSPRYWYDNITFNGHIDGDGHTVYGVFMPFAGSEYYEAGGQGLISKVEPGGTVDIKNLAIDKAFCSSVGYTSAFIGVANDAATVVFENCLVGDDVTVRGHSATAFMATGKTNSPTISITNCANLGTLEAMGTKNAYEGLVGDFWSGTVVVKNSYNKDGYIYNKSNCSGSANNYGLEAGHANAGTIALTEENMKGRDVLYSADKMNLLGGGFTAMGTGKYPLPWVLSGKTMPDFWDGTTVAPTGDGSTEENPIMINTPEELAFVVANGGSGKYYKLANDIYLNNTDVVDWLAGTHGTGVSVQDWGNVLKDASVFTGHIDGDGHTVYGMYVEQNNTEYGYSTSSGYGFIGKATSGAVSIKNLGIDNAYVHAATHTAAFIGTTAGNTEEVVIDSCYVGADVKIVGAGAAAYIGMAANSTSTLISNCYNLGTMEAKGGSGLGGYVGFMSEFYGSGTRVVKNSYNANGPISGGQSLSAGSGNNYETVTGSASAYATYLIADNMKGADVLSSADKMPNLGNEWTDMGAGKYPVPWAFSGKVKPDIWDGNQVAPTKGGDGSSEENAIIIETPEELAFVVANGGSGKYYKLNKDIYLNDIARVNWETGESVTSNYAVKNWLLRGEVTGFSGTIDGNGHTIYGLRTVEMLDGGKYFEQGEVGIGLLPKVNTGAAVTIKNLGIDNAYVHGSCNAGAFVGIASGAGSDVTVVNSFAGANVYVVGQNAATFVGVSAAGAPTVTISNCYSFANLTAKGTSNSYIGFLGDSWSGTVNIANSYNANGPIYQKSNTGTYENNYETVAGSAKVAATLLSVDNMKGADVLTNESKMPLLGEEWTEMGDENFPVQWIYSGKERPVILDTWDGTTVAPTKGGDGSSAEQAIEITTPEEFAYIFQNGGDGKYYKLTTDIYLNKLDKINWTDGTVADGYTPNAWTSARTINATINGNGHVVHGLYFNNNISGEDAVAGNGGNGLIPSLVNGTVTITGLGIDDAYVAGTNASAFVGHIGSSGWGVISNATLNIDQCYVGSNVKIKGRNASAFLSGALYNEDGGLDTTTITNCYNLGTLEGTASSGLYAGVMWTYQRTLVSATNSYNATGPISTLGQTVSASNNYALEGSGDKAENTILLSADNMKGADVLTADTKMPLLGEEWTEMGEGNYPVQWIFSGKEKPDAHEHSYDNACDKDCNVCGETRETSHAYDNACDKDCNVCGETRETSHVYDDENDVDCNICGETREVKSDYWTGETEPTKGGDGSSADEAILIETANEFAWVIANGGNDKYYKLASDIYLNNVDKINWADGTKLDDAYTVRKWGDLTQTAFGGTIDGDGHTIYGMYNNDYPSAYYEAGGFGLIKQVATGKVATLKNLGLDKSFNHSVGYAAGFVGVMPSGGSAFFENCYVGAEVTIKGHNASAFVATGKLDAPSVSILNCYSTATQEVMGTNNAYAGLVGDFWSGSVVIKNSYNAKGYIYNKSNVTASNTYGLEAGHANAATTVLTADNMKGADVLTAASKMPNLGEEWTEMGDGNYPVQWIFSGKEKPAPLDVWEGGTVEPTGDGSTAENAIEITTPEQLAWVVANGGAGKYYKLSNDIYLNKPSSVDWATGTYVSGTVQSWEPISKATVFTGHIDGNGHTVYGMYIEQGNTSYGWSATGGYGFIAKATDGAVSIKNMGIDKAYVHVSTYASAFIGSTANNTSEVVIDSCYVGADVTVKGNGAAAFIGNAITSTSTLISNSYNLGTTTAKGSAGAGYGFMSEFYGAGNRVVKNSYNANGPISSAQSVAGSENNYETVAGVANANATLLTTDNMKGADVLTSASKMPNLGAEWTEMGDGNYPVPWAFSGKEKPHVHSYDNACDKDCNECGEQRETSHAYDNACDKDCNECGEQRETSHVYDNEYDIDCNVCGEERELDLPHWNGKTVEPTKGGDGSSAETAILIEEPEEFAWVIANGGNNKYYKLADDIYLNNVDKINWVDGTKLDSQYTVQNWGGLTQTAFSGTIDGDGHTIYGMYTNDYPTEYFEAGGMALIKQIATGKTATFKNLGLDKSFNHSVGYAAGFVGVMPSGGSVIFENCYVGADVTIKGHSASAFLATGKLDAPSVSILNCYSLATQEAKGTTNAYAGLVGDFWSGSVVIKNSYNAKGYIYNKSNVTASNTYGLEAGHANAATIALIEDNMKGEDVLTNPNKMPGLGEEWAQMGDGNFPVQWIFSGREKPVFEYFEGWDGKTFTAPTKGGNGSDKENAIVIETAAELAYVIKNGGEGKYYILGNDIHLNDLAKVDWTTGKAINETYVVNNWLTRNDTVGFYGTLDGNGHTIYGIVANEYTGDYAAHNSIGGGLIPKANSGNAVTIKNLGIDSSYIHNSSNAGAFIGAAQVGNPEITFEACYVGKNVTVIGYNAAAFVGVASFNPDWPAVQQVIPSIVIDNSYNLGTLTKKGDCVGFVGDSWGGSVSVNFSFNATGPIYEKNSAGNSSCNYEAVAGHSAMNALVRTPENMKGADVLLLADKMPLLDAEWTEMGDGNYPVPWIFSGKEKPDGPDYWNSKTEKPTKGGDGSNEAQAIIIETSKEFAYVIKNGGQGKYYKLANDIYLNKYEKVDWSTGTSTDANYTPKAWYTRNDVTAFSGTLDGDGHTVYGVLASEYTGGYAQSASAGAGLIPNVNSGSPAVIKNLAINCSYIHSSNNAGAFIGLAGVAGSDITIDSCYVGSNVYVAGQNAAAFVGVVVAGNPTVTISNSYNQGTLTNMNTSASYIGLVGDSWSGQVNIAQCYNATGPIYMKNNAGTYENNYEAVAGSANKATLLDSELMKGVGAKDTMENLGQYYVTTENYPQLVVFMKDGLNPEINKAIGYKGSGTAEDPFLITNADELYRAVGTFGRGKHYKLTNDIYLNDIEAIDWWTGKVKQDGYQPLEWFTSDSTDYYYGIGGKTGTFYGTIDGDGYAVYGIYYPNGNQSIVSGLIPVSYAAPTLDAARNDKYNTVVKDLAIKNSAIGASGSTAAVVGYMPWGSRVFVDGCHIDQTTYVRSWKYGNPDTKNGSGGIVGLANGYITLNIANTGIYATSGTIYYDETTPLPDGCTAGSWGRGAFFFGTNGDANANITISNCIAKIDNTSGPYVAPHLGSPTISVDTTYVNTLPNNFDWVDGFTVVTSLGDKEGFDDTALNNNDWYVTEGNDYPIRQLVGQRGGDADMDGLFATTADLAVLRQVIMGTYHEDTLADSNCDGNVNIADLVCLNNNKNITASEGLVNTKMVGDVKFKTRNFKVTSATAIVYLAGNTYSKNAANEIYGYYRENGVEVMAPATSASESAVNVIYVGGKEVGDDGNWSIKIDGDGLYFTATDGGYAMLAQYYTALPYKTEMVWTANAPAAEFGNEFDGTATIDGTSYTYVWGDEFNGSTVDSSKWLYSKEATRMVPIGDDQSLSSGTDSIKVTKDGEESFMRLTAYKNAQGKYIVPSSLQTTQKMAYKYGYAEIRAKIPSGYGCWPSFWLMSSQEQTVHKWTNPNKPLGTNGDNTTFTSEIDVFEFMPKRPEYVGGDGLELQQYLQATTHMWWIAEPGKSTHGSLNASYESKLIDNLSTEYHIIGFKWDENGTKMYIDGELYGEFNYDNQVWDSTISDDQYNIKQDKVDVSARPAYNDPHVLIFNNHLYTPEASGKPSTVPEDFVSSFYDIDYIRLYQNADCEIYTGIEQQYGLN